MLFVEPVTSKKNQHVAEKFEKMLERMDQPPQNLNTDRGKILFMALQAVQHKFDCQVGNLWVSTFNPS